VIEQSPCAWLYTETGKVRPVWLQLGISEHGGVQDEETLEKEKPSMMFQP
jgi:hypothetical protein